MILSRLKQLVGPSVNTLRARCLHWTPPLTSFLPLPTLADLVGSKPELIADPHLDADLNTRDWVTLFDRATRKEGVR